MSRVDGELKQLRVQVEDALDALNQGEDGVKQRRAQLAEWKTCWRPPPTTSKT